MVMVHVKELSSTLLANREGRLDKIVLELLNRDDFSRSMISRFIKDQGVRVNEVLVFKPSFSIKKGDIIQISWKLSLSDSIEAQDVHFKVIWEDEDILVISKPPGVVVHPGTGNPDRTLVNGLVYHYPEIKFVGSSDRPGIVHRLDKYTSGIMMVARTQRAYQLL
ncbi:MAG TPA: RluA family pseudouridine synthase, partial [Candidatus Atribacteria bacterium]|nr:RluA family pseudouridine synthase [Candidatus Atribacteria bacterium]